MNNTGKVAVAKQHSDKLEYTTDMLLFSLFQGTLCIDIMVIKKIRYPHEFTMPTELPYVRNLQTSAIFSVNRTYDRKAKITNLKQMADTIMYVEKHGFETREDLEKAYSTLYCLL